MNAPSGRGLTSDTDKWFDDSMENSPTYQQNPGPIGTHARAIALFSRARRRDTTLQTFTERCTIRNNEKCLSEGTVPSTNELAQRIHDNPPLRDSRHECRGSDRPSSVDPTLPLCQGQSLQLRGPTFQALCFLIPEFVICRFSSWKLHLPLMYGDA